MATYKITYFSTETKKINTKIFEGENSFEDAKKWGEKTIQNFSVEMIQKKTTEENKSEA